MDLELSRIFVKVVQNGSFSRAADLLKVPKSTVSKAVTRLERTTGTKLLLRTTRSLTLTAAGRAFFDACRGPIHLLEDAEKSLHGRDSILSGPLKITAAEDLGNAVIAPAIAEFSRQHRELSFELVYTDEVVDLVKDGYDLAFRIGAPAESSFKAKRVGDVLLIPVAAPAYLKSVDKIRVPRDLEARDCLSYNDQTIHTRWHLRRERESVSLQVTPRISSNQMSSLRQATLAGAGVALLPQFLCTADLSAGRLVRVLPGWSSPPMPVSMISPLPTSSSVRLKLTAELLGERVRQALKG